MIGISEPALSRGLLSEAGQILLPGTGRSEYNQYSLTELKPGTEEFSLQII